MINSFYYLEPASNRWIDFDQAQASFPETSFEVDPRFLAAGKEIHAAAERNTQRPFQETLLGKENTQRPFQETLLGNKIHTTKLRL